MLFIGFTSAYLLRRASADWRPLAAPVHALGRTPPRSWRSSVTPRGGAAAAARLGPARARFPWWRRPGSWASLFLAGQVLAWRQLAAQGVFLASNPHSSFFYVLTGRPRPAPRWAGSSGSLAVLVQVRRLAYTPGEDGLRLFATYWHFLGGLWLYLLVLLFVL